MRFARFRLTMRTLMMAVAVVAVILGAYASGYRDGRQYRPVPPQDAALAFVKSIRFNSDEEACAVYTAAELMEHSSPGALAG